DGRHRQAGSAQRPGFQRCRGVCRYGSLRIRAFSSANSASDSTPEDRNSPIWRKRSYRSAAGGGLTTESLGNADRWAASTMAWISARIRAPLIWAGKEACGWSATFTSMVANPIQRLRRCTSWTSASPLAATPRTDSSLGQLRRRHTLEVALDGGLHGCDHGAFDEGSIAHEHATRAVGKLFDRHLGAEHGAAQVDQDQHAFRSTHVLNCGENRGRVRAEPAVSGAARDRDLNLALGHLRRQLSNALRQLPAVRDQDQANGGHTPSPGCQWDARTGRPCRVRPASGTSRSPPARNRDQPP